MNLGLLNLKMRVELIRRLIKKTSKDENIAAQVRRLTDKDEILSYLEPQRAYSATAIAHLEPKFSLESKWFIARSQDRFALCLISKSMSPDYMFILGDKSTLTFLFQSISLPGEAYITCQPEHLEIVERYYEFKWHYLMKRMVATRESFTPASRQATRLRPAHVKEINQLYKIYTGNIFTKHQIRKGVYYGIWHDGRLVSVAGTHLISPTYGLAYVGNVFTHPSYRNQGLATICTSSVTAELLDFCTEVVLNVEPTNWAAIKAYASLGYMDHCPIVEALGQRKSLIGALLVNFWRKLALNST